MNKEKRCKRCEDMGKPFMHPLSAFSSNRSQKDKLSFYCKSCECDMIKMRRIVHYEETRQREQTWRDANKETVRTIARKTYHKRRDKLLPEMRQSYQEHKEQRLTATKQWNAEHPERTAEAGLRSRYRRHLFTAIIAWTLTEPHRVFVFNALYTTLQTLLYEDAMPTLTNEE